MSVTGWIYSLVMGDQQMGVSGPGMAYGPAESICSAGCCILPGGRGSCPAQHAYSHQHALYGGPYSFCMAYTATPHASVQVRGVSLDIIAQVAKQAQPDALKPVLPQLVQVRAGAVQLRQAWQQQYLLIEQYINRPLVTSAELGGPSHTCLPRLAAWTCLPGQSNGHEVGSPDHAQLSWFCTFCTFCTGQLSWFCLVLSGSLGGSFLL
jgi:hypothetical protein